MVTGFHGLHVIVGVIFIVECLFRFKLGHFTKKGIWVLNVRLIADILSMLFDCFYLLLFINEEASFT